MLLMGPREDAEILFVASWPAAPCFPLRGIVPSTRGCRGPIARLRQQNRMCEPVDLQTELFFETSCSFSRRPVHRSAAETATGFKKEFSLEVYWFTHPILLAEPSDGATAPASRWHDSSQRETRGGRPTG